MAKRANLRVVTGGRTWRILFDGRRAVGAEMLIKGEKRTFRARREVIVSSGAFGSPQILLLSGIGDAEALKAQGILPLQHLPRVGRNLQDHPYFVFAYESASADLIGYSLRC